MSRHDAVPELKVCCPADTRWEFVCLLPLFDPPRHDTKATVEACREKGIDVKMVTGDQLLIGKETSRQLGMGTNMYSTEALLEVHPALLHTCCQAGPSGTAREDTAVAE